MSLTNVKLIRPQVFRMTRLMSSAILKADIEKLTKPMIFRLKLPKNDDYATIEFEESKKEYHLIHTNVPDGYKGQGVGKIIAELNSSSYAYINYILDGNVFHMYETEVPEKYRGQGFAYSLAQKTFDFIVANDKRMRLSCHFLEKFFEDNKKKYEKFVVP